MECTKGDWRAHEGMEILGQAGLTYVADCYLSIAELIETAVNAYKCPVAESIGEMFEAKNSIDKLVKLFNDWVDERIRDYEDMPASCSHSTFLVLVGKVDTLNSAKVNLARLAQKVMAR